MAEEWRQLLTINFHYRERLHDLESHNAEVISFGLILPILHIRLYTSIPHEKLKHRIHKLLEKTYAVRRKSFIATGNFRTFWTDEKKCNRYHFSCRDLCRAIDFLIDNIFVRFGGKIFRQVIGIPMGTNSAPLLADLFLHTYEYEFIIKTMKGDITRALQFNKTFRYIDDLLCVNNEKLNKPHQRDLPIGINTEKYNYYTSGDILPRYYLKHWRGKWNCKDQRLQQKGRLQLQDCELSVPGQ